MHSLRHLALLVILLACVPLQAAQRPNILFILTEDQGAQLGHIGTPGLQTPHMDALARSGMYFRNVFVAYPVCSASKAALYTGLHNHANGILNNTVNYAKHAAQLTPQERKHPLYLSNGVHASIPTLVERLQAAGYYQGATHKLHVAPVEKFPYDEFIRHNNRAEVAGFIARAAKTGKPWHLFYNIPNSHRPFPNSEKVQIRVKPDEVKLPAYLPDTPVVRRDWAEYLAAIEAADQVVGEGLAALRASGQEANTIIVFMGDHGPCFPHGKMTPYDLGLRVPLIIRTPSMQAGVISDALASELDLTPTLLDLLGLEALPKSHGVSLRPVLEGRPGATGHRFIYAEISHRGVLPNTGMQERSIYDGRWHLIYREKLTPPWRQVQADSKDWKPWGNRTYAEVVRGKAQFPVPFRILAEMDPQNLGGKVQPLELYDLQIDPDELHNLVGNVDARMHRDRLYAALRQWVRDTADPAVQPPPTPPE
ncbi:MAG: sulfatase [Rhodopirellula sp.]|nr:sulfatase [Rhodopirellula sp.]